MMGHFWAREEGLGTANNEYLTTFYWDVPPYMGFQMVGSPFYP